MNHLKKIEDRVISILKTNAASGLSTTSIFPTRIPAAFPAEFPFGKCGTNTRQK